MSLELLRILIAAPSASVRSALTEALPRADSYETIVRKALDASVVGGPGVRPDVILLELTGPEETGLEDVRHALGLAGRLPVVVVTPPEHATLGLKAVQQGCADRLFTDHLEPTAVQRAVRHAIELARSERRRQQAERALSESEQHYRSLFEQSRDAIFMTDPRGQIMEVNRAALDLLGYEADELIGQDLGRLFAYTAERDGFRSEIERHGHIADFEARLRRSDGHERWCAISAWIRKGSRDRIAGYQGIIHDISERKAIEARLTHEVLHDALTGLPNRVLFMDRLERALARRRRSDGPDVALLFLDLDRFKMVNDSLGHLAGDELLRRLGRLLAEEVRDEDTIARIAGDEFAILLDGVEEPAVATNVARRVQSRLRSPFRLQGHEVFTSVSIGITFAGLLPREPGVLLQEADTAMYRAKALGPGRYQIYDPEMHTQAITVLQLETDLRLALERDEFVLHYQPLIDLATGRVRGFEALARWQHPEHGLIQPQAFIPAAEQNGLIVPLGAWVLETAIAQIREWQDADPALENLFVSVNLSAHQFTSGDIEETVASILDDHGVHGSALRLEITETAMLESPAAAIRSLQRLRKLGVVVCIDDFGTGFSSLHILHELPVDILKIDRSFIRRLDENGDDHIVETILALAHNLGLDSVAEGVETERQLDRLRDFGSSTVQGFLFSVPVDADHASDLLADRNLDAVPE